MWNEMREQPTLPHSDKYGGFFVVTRLADLRKVTAKPALFSSAKGVALPSEDRSPHIPEEVDPPLHGEYRRLLEPFLTQDEVAKLEPMVRRHVLDLLDSFAGETRIDFVRRFSEPLPVRFSLEAFGFPREDEAMLFDLVSRIIGERGKEGGRIAAKGLSDYLARLLDLKAAPGTSASDIVTAIASGSIENRPLTIDEKVSMTRLLLFGGFTTVNIALSSTLFQFTRNPELVQQLRDNPSLITTAVDEFVRLASPGTYLRRTVTADVELGGTQLHPGDQVLLCFGAANRDPTTFSNPDDVQLDRNPNPHVGFGFGAHRCMGSWVGKLEIKVALEELLKRYDRFELDPEAQLEWGSGETQGLTTLPLILHPR
ncbi:cytochrome P450 [Xanthobacter flavus]|uniref:cytochrome P450 n=1 Tax=Xanthobacter flavus TaxID=281 RepID=UPI00372B16DB